jgi:hypothetical protein
LKNLIPLMILTKINQNPSPLNHPQSMHIDSGSFIKLKYIKK